MCVYCCKWQLASQSFDSRDVIIGCLIIQCLSLLFLPLFSLSLLHYPFHPLLCLSLTRTVAGRNHPESQKPHASTRGNCDDCIRLRIWKGAGSKHHRIPRCCHQPSYMLNTSTGAVPALACGRSAAAAPALSQGEK